MWEIDFEQGLELFHNGKLEEAECRLAVAATQIDLESAGPELFGQVYLTLSQVRQAQRRWVQALDALTRSIHPLRKAYGPHDPRLAVLLHQLGRLIAYTGKAAEGEPALMESLSIVRRSGAMGASSGNPRALASYLAMLADFYLFHRAPQRAVGHLEEAAQVLHQCFGPADAQACHLQLALADILDRLDKSQESEALLERTQQAAAGDLPLSFEICLKRAQAHQRKRSWDNSHRLLSHCLTLTAGDERRVALIQGQLGQSLIGLARYGEAEGALGQAYQMWMKILGQAHPQVGIAAADLARLWQGQGRLQDAEQGYQFGHSVLHQSLGEGHPLTLSLCDRLIEIPLQRKDYMRAHLLTIETLKVRSRLYGDQHPLVAESLSMLGRIWLEQRQFSQAADVLAQCLGIYALYPPSGEYPAILARYGLGAALQGVYKYYEAEEHYREVIQELEQYYGDSHFLLPHVLRNLGWLLRQTGRDRAAAESTKRAQALTEAAATR